MDSSVIGGVVRAVLASVGGVLVSKGYIDDATLQSLVGAIVVIGTAGWSIVQKKSAAKKLAAAEAAPAVTK